MFPRPRRLDGVEAHETHWFDFHTGLTDKHAQFKNLDPFRVLVLDTDATPDDIKNRYKKMSVLCHPDKNGGSDQAKQAFEAVKDAYARLSDEKKRDRTILVIEGARERCRQERAFKLSKGVDPDTLPPEEEALQKEVAKTFAQNEMKRRDVEEHNRVQQQRERDQAAEAEKKEADEKLFEKQWNTDDRCGPGWELFRETSSPDAIEQTDLETPSRRWLGASTPSSRRSYGDNIASMARGA